MAFALSNFDATVPEVRAMADRMFGADFDTEQYKETALFRTIAENQPVQMERNFAQNGRCTSVDVFSLLDDDAITITDNGTDDCVITGDEIGIKKASYTNNINLRASFTVYDDDCPNDVVARDKFLFGQSRVIHKIQSALAKKVGPKLAMNADVNKFPTDFSGGTVVTNYLEVAASYFTDTNGISTFYKNAKKQHFGDNLRFINGANYFELNFNAMYKRDGCCDVDSVLQGGAFRYTWDLDNLDTPILDASLDPVSVKPAATTATPLSFVMRDGSLFFFSNNMWQNTVQREVKSDTYVWRQALPDLRYRNGGGFEPIYLDVKSQRICTDGKYGTVYEYVLRGGLHTGQEMNDGTLGILAYYGYTA